jgi:hypothetical protein
MKHIKQKHTMIFSGLLVFFVITACSNPFYDSVLGELESGKEITGFRIGETAGLIDREAASITLLAPHETTEFTPAIAVSRGARVNKKSGEFPGISIYTVKAEDGKNKDWTVTVILLGGIGIDLSSPGIAWDYTGADPALSKGAGDTLTIIITGETYDDYYWSVDYTLVSAADSVTLNAVDYTPGAYTLVLIVSKDSEYYSKTLNFTITN